MRRSARSGRRRPPPPSQRPCPCAVASAPPRTPPMPDPAPHPAPVSARRGGGAGVCARSCARRLRPHWRGRREIFYHPRRARRCRCTGRADVPRRRRGSRSCCIAELRQQDAVRLFLRFLATDLKLPGTPYAHARGKRFQLRPADETPAASSSARFLKSFAAAGMQQRRPRPAWRDATPHASEPPRGGARAKAPLRHIARFGGSVCAGAGGRDDHTLFI